MLTNAAQLMLTNATPLMLTDVMLNNANAHPGALSTNANANARNNATATAGSSNLYFRNIC